MNLVFVSNLFPDESSPTRGLDNATLLHRLAERSAIRVLALRPTLPWTARRWSARGEDRAFDPQFVPVPYLPKIGSRVNHFLAASALREPLRALRRRFPFEAVLGSWLYPDCCALSLLARELGFPLVAIAQGSDVHQYLKIPARREIVRLLLPSASAIVTRSADLARLLAEAGLPREKLHPIVNGIDLDRFRPGDRAAARLALHLHPTAPLLLSFVGNLLPIKQPLRLLRAHALLCREAQFADAALVVIGEGPLARRMRAEAAASFHGEQVCFVGRKNPAEVALYLQAADVLCLPSDNEGVPNVLLEAFASGLPVVASRVGGIPEVHTGDFLGRLTPPGDIAALSSALHAVLRNPPDSAAIRAHAQAFSWPRAAAACHALLEQAAVSPSAP